jgi:hypothetical protein
MPRLEFGEQVRLGFLPLALVLEPHDSTVVAGEEGNRDLGVRDDFGLVAFDEGLGVDGSLALL